MLVARSQRPCAPLHETSTNGGTKGSEAAVYEHTSAHASDKQHVVIAQLTAYRRYDLESEHRWTNPA